MNRYPSRVELELLFGVSLPGPIRRKEAPPMGLERAKKWARDAKRIAGRVLKVWRWFERRRR